MKYIMVMVLMLGLSACGNTITGVGKDISDVGTKVTNWQNKSADVETKPIPENKK